VSGLPGAPRLAPTIWSRLVERLDHREPATALALFRIGMGLSILYTLIPMMTDEGLTLLWVDAAEGGFRPLSARHWLVEALGGPSLRTSWGLSVAAVIAGLLLVIGLGGRLSAALALVLMMALFSLSPGTGGGHDRLHTNGLWLLVLAPSTATLSLDARLFGPQRRFFSTQAVPAWVRYVGVVQLVLVYWSTGLQKVGAEWMPWGGLSAVYYALLTPSWQRWEMSWLGHPLIFLSTQVGTAATWLWESLAPVWLLAFWFRATRERPGALRAWSNRVDLRSWWALFGLLLHLVLWVTMNLGPFSAVTLSFYALLFHPDEWRALGLRLRRATQ
jgi:hypothetical protein